MSDIANARDSAMRFDIHDALLKKTLAASGSNNCFALSVSYCNVGFDLIFQLPFPEINIVICSNVSIRKDLPRLGYLGYSASLFSNQATQHAREIF